jgi:hypothetical protein
MATKREIYTIPDNVVKTFNTFSKRNLIPKSALVTQLLREFFKKNKISYNFDDFEGTTEEQPFENISEKERIEKEKCSQDPIYFIETYVKVLNIFSNRIEKFKMFDFQKDIINQYEENKNNLVLHSRQVGISTITAAYVCCKLLFSNDETILYISNDGPCGRKFLAKVGDILNNLPNFIFDNSYITRNMTKKIQLDNENMLMISSNDTSIPGQAFSMCIIDNTAFVKNADKILKTVIPALKPNGKITLLSCPSEKDVLFADYWEKSLNEKNNFNRIKIHWSQRPGYNEGLEERFDSSGKRFLWSPWYQNMCEKLENDEQKIKMELEAEFPIKETTI